MSFETFGNSLSFKIGKLFGGILNKKLFKNKVFLSTEGKRLETINVQTVKYGKEIPIVYGNVKLAGNIIWDSGLKELKNVISESQNTPNQSSEYSYTKYEYKISLAIALCEGEIEGVSRIWINNIIINKSLYNIRVYNGSNQQLPDPLIEKVEGKGKTCAFRGIAYVVFEDFPISKFKNQIPKFNFEVIRNSNINNPDNLQNLINSVVIIPGSGEYVYDTQIQKKNYYKNEPYEYIEISINNNTDHSQSDAVVSLNQLKTTLPNVKWVSPVVNWYATNLDAGISKILPGVEYQGGKVTVTPDEWKVSNYDRNTAYVISKKHNQPIYGGTINDMSILRFLDELKNRGYSIMFYPMVLVDEHNKPWRGRIYANNESDVNNFFDGEIGYNQFILHYAKLVKGKVDAFLIGSEMIGLTKFKSKGDKFPTVEKLIELAKQVKEILGKNVKISYGADWSEFHHTDGGWYNLDKLWASEYIDFVGIDAYFPLTNNNKTTYELQEVMDAWEAGEGYDYYLDAKGKKQPLDAGYAWKNIKWWWENKHINPDGNKTNWQPKSKKIWFTEIGFPSIDCATNQPNVFYDPSSAESNIPKHSKGKVDFQAQKIGLLATEMKWKDSSMIENKFIWAWDARPYPSWPDRKDVWADGDCWIKGHWIQGKFFQSNLNAVLLDICKKVNLKAEQIDVSKINSDIIGFCIFDNSTAKNIIKDLSKLYHFAVYEEGQKIDFIPKESRALNQIDSGDIVVKQDDMQSTFSVYKLGSEELISEVKLNYIIYDQEYVLTNATAKNYQLNHNNEFFMDASIILTESEADEMVQKLLNDFSIQDTIIAFALPIIYAHLKPNDLMQIEYKSQSYILEIVKIEIKNISTINIFGIQVS